MLQQEPCACQQNRGFRCSTQSRRCAGEAASSVLDRGGGRCGVVASNAWAPELVGRVGWILVSGRITLRHIHGDGLLQREIQPGQSLNSKSDSQCVIGWFQALVLNRHACSLALRGLRPGEPSRLRDRLGWPYALPPTWPPVRMQGCGDPGVYPCTSLHRDNSSRASVSARVWSLWASGCQTRGRVSPYSYDSAILTATNTRVSQDSRLAGGLSRS